MNRKRSPSKNGASKHEFNLPKFNLEPRVAHIVIEEGPYAGLELYAKLEMTIDTFEHMQALQNDPAKVSTLLTTFGDEFLERWNLYVDDDEVSADSAGMRTLPIALGMEIISHWVEAAVGVSVPLEQTSNDGEPLEELLTDLASRSKSLPN